MRKHKARYSTMEEAIRSYAILCYIQFNTTLLCQTINFSTKEERFTLL